MTQGVQRKLAAIFAADVMGYGCFKSEGKCDRARSALGPGCVKTLAAFSVLRVFGFG